MRNWRYPTPAELEKLSSVGTIREVANACFVDVDTIRLHCQSGKIIAQQTKQGIWLVLFASAEEVYGVKVEPARA